ncbi:amidohydrolase [Marinilabilia rubra]|uniref:Omega-amidase YafV n=1 Tax=Marinilabilia rubra TaxID=2162893 RepID=A0A2U2BC83_9BACT|nr:amidohydrolase [Marinilabilia rubra]PWE00678.1 amidohydrolase [Marinilabilia rubra]
MKVALIEKELHWENIEKNLTDFEQTINQIPYDCSLVILPEMFSTGFTMNPKKFSTEELEKVPEWMIQMAYQTGFCICGSSIAKEEDGYFNRFYFAFPDRALRWYDKKHLFRMGNESEIYTPGKERKIFTLGEWRIMPQVCYDLRFPVWNRNQDDYDFSIYVSNWPAARKDAWLTLLKARAIENQCYVAGVNRVGKDPNVPYDGGTVVFSPKGDEISQVVNGQWGIIIADIKLDALKAFRDKFPAWKDRDSFNLDGPNLS